MRIVTSVKCVPDGESVYANSDRSLDFSSAVWQISQYDLNAVEAAKQLQEKNEDVEIIALTAGGSIIEDGRRRKDILSRGAAKLYCVQNDELQGAAADSFFVASTLAESIKKIGDVDLVLFGEGSGDMYSQQTGLVVGALLGVPVVNGVSKIELVDGKLKLRRSLDDGVEQLEVSLPAVVCVSADINVPRFTSVRDTLSAGKKPFEIWPLQEVCAPRHGSVTVSVLAPEQTGRNQQVYQSPDEAAIKAVAAELKKYI